MIIPANNIPPDDNEESAADDQQSQKDIHSNGFDDQPETGNNDASDAERLQQASDASTPSFTLNVDDEPRKKEDQ